MKLLYFWLTLTAPLAGLMTPRAHAQQLVATTMRATSRTAPVDLRMENAAVLLGTDVLRPRLSWLAPPGTIARQTHYQVQVALSPDFQRGTLVWDTGNVASARRAQIEYAGPRLQSRTIYYWRVRTGHGPSQPGDWSQPARWETGLLEPGDWRAQWVGDDQAIEHVWTDATTEWQFTPITGTVDFLFRASPVGKTFGEAYAWRLDTTSGPPKLLGISRTYDGSKQAVVRERVLKSIPLPLTRAQLLRRPHVLAIEAVGTSIVTYFDGKVVDRLVDADHARGTAGIFQPGGPTLSAPLPGDALVLHALSVTPVGGQKLAVDFARNANPLSGGSVEADGLHPANAKGVDIVFPQGGAAPLLRKEFIVHGQIARARLYVAAGGFPRIEINGGAVNEAIGDGFTAYDRRVLYRTLDVTDQIQPGANAIGVELGRGWYDLAEPNEWYWHTPPWHARPALLLQLELTMTDGSRQTIATDGSWRTHPGPTLHDSIYAGERYDARLAQRGWSTTDFNAARWSPVALVKGPAGQLDAAEQQPIAVIETLHPVGLTQPRPGVWVYDFGRIFAGRIRLRLQGPAGHTISLIQHEKLRDDGTVWALSTHVDAQLQTEQYTLAGTGMEEWAPQFGYRGFRYVEVRGFPGTPSLDSLTGEVMHSNLASVGEFESSNPLLNRIQVAARATILNNMHGFQTDTPTFEKNGWTGDAQASALAAALNFDVSRVWTKWLADFRDAQSPKGEIPEIVPSTPLYGYENTPGWSMVEGPTPPWDAAAFVLPSELYKLTGDTRVLAEMYDAQKKLVDYTATWFSVPGYRFLRADRTELGEYAYPRTARRVVSATSGSPSEIDAVSAAYLFYMTDQLARNASRLGKRGDMSVYRQRAARIRAAFNRTYWDSERGFYRVPTTEGSSAPFVQYLNVLPVAFGLVPDRQAAGVIGKVADDIAMHDYHLSSIGVYSGRYVLTLLSDYGHVDTAYKVVSQTSEPSWGYWLSHGIGTMLEGWELDSRSRDHHYWASVSSWFYEGLAGIRAARPAYERIVIRPAVPTGLMSATAQLETVQGHIASSWHQAEGVVTLDVGIPPGMTAEVWCPQFASTARKAPVPRRITVVHAGTHRLTCDAR